MTAVSEFRRMPANDDAERAVLSCMLQDPVNLIAAAGQILHSAAFYTPANRIVFDLLTAGFSHCEVDLVMLQTELRKKGLLDKAGGAQYLAELINDVPTVAMFDYYAEELIRKSRCRQLIEICSETAKNAWEESGDPLELARRLEDYNSRLFESVAATSTTTWRNTLIQYEQEIDSARNNKGGIPGLSTGFSAVDDMTGGLQRNEMWVLAGRPGSGKSAIMVNVAVHLVKAGIPVGIISLEMSRSKLAGRIVSGITGINSQKLSRGMMSDADRNEIGRSVSESSLWPLYIDDRPGLRLFDIEIQCRKWVKNHGIEVIFVDYLQLVEPDQNREIEEREVADKSRGLLNLARRHQITTFALAQLNRGAENRSGPPRKSDLRGSGSIEQDAHVIALLDRTDPGDESAIITVNCIIAKCREGREGTVPLNFNRPVTTFFEPGRSSCGR
ncbi:MAG: replicative DNA helicase [Verrucomicrobiales bacterium]|nr:replicative DNA helicase [Verrucomicrobiales bacterium]